MSHDKKADVDFVADMEARAEQLEPVIVEPEKRVDPSGKTTLQHVSRLCLEWATADPIKTIKEQSVYGTWAQIWNEPGCRGVFSINLNTGSVWWVKRNPPQKPIGNVRELTGQELVDLLGDHED
jgi:hypothetical protein